MNKILCAALALSLLALGACGLFGSVDDDTAAAVITQAAYDANTAGPASSIMKGIINRAISMNGTFSIDDEDGKGSVTLTVSGTVGDGEGVSYDATVAYDDWTVVYEEEEYDLNGSLTEDYSCVFDMQDLTNITTTSTISVDGTVTVSKGLSSSDAAVDLTTTVTASIVTEGQTVTVTVTATSTGTVNGKAVNETYTLTASDA